MCFAKNLVGVSCVLKNMVKNNAVERIVGDGQIAGFNDQAAIARHLAFVTGATDLRKTLVGHRGAVVDGFAASDTQLEKVPTQFALDMRREQCPLITQQVLAQFLLLPKLPVNLVLNY